MRIRRAAISAAFATGFAVLPLATAQAQYYPYAPYYGGCSPNPLAWPFCAAGAIVGAAATIATAPFWLLAGAPYYGYYAPPYYPAPSYYGAGYYPPSYVTYTPPPAQAPQAAPGAPVPPPPPPSKPRAPASSARPLVRYTYYLCPTSQAYYPSVASCPVAWQRIQVTQPQS